MEEIKEEEVKEEDLDDEKSIITVLKTMPEKIRKIEEAIYSLEIKKGELISVNKTIENDIKREVAAETEEKEVKGEMKTVKKFSNDMARDSQTTLRLSNKKDYESNRQKADNMDKSINSNKIGLSYMKRILRSAEALVYAGK